MNTTQLSNVVGAVGTVAGSISPLAGMILFGIKEAIALEPSIEAELADLFSEGAPTEADWAAVRARVAQPFSALAPNSAAQIDAAQKATAGTVAPPPPPAPTPAAAAAPSIAPALPAPEPPDASGNPVL